MTPASPSVPGQSTESVDRVSQAAPTYVPTYGLTKNLQDSGDSLTLRNAHENNEVDANVIRIDTALRAVVDQLGRAFDRMDVIRNNRPGTVDPRIRKAVYMRDSYTCQWCNTHVARCLDPLEIDHVIPWSAGGSNATDNLRALCAMCNAHRSNRYTDVGAARPLLIVGHCVRCKGRRYVRWNESPTGIPGFVWDEDERATVTDDYLEVPVWCVECREPSTTSRVHADEVRRRQAELYAPFPEGVQG